MIIWVRPGYEELLLPCEVVDELAVLDVFDLGRVLDRGFYVVAYVKQQGLLD